MSLLLSFFRFKNQTLILTNTICPELLSEILKEIRCKKLFKCILKEELPCLFEEKVLTGHIDIISCIALLDKTHLASGSEYIDKSIKIWKLSSGDCIKSLYGHTHTITSLMKLNKNQLASGCDDYSIKVWNFQTGICLFTLKGHKQIGIMLAKLNDTQFVSSCSDKTIKIWDFTNGYCIKTLTDNISEFTIIIRLNKTRIATGNFLERTIQIWDITNGICLKTFDKSIEEDKIRNLVRINNKLLASSSYTIVESKILI